MRVVGYVALLFALGFLAAAKGRYLVQPAAERGPFARTLVYGLLGAACAVIALVLIPGER